MFANNKVIKMMIIREKGGVEKVQIFALSNQRGFNGWSGYGDIHQTPALRHKMQILDWS